MRALITGLTFLMIASVYMLEVSMTQAQALAIHQITYVDENDQVVHRDYYAAGTDLSDYQLPEAPERMGYVFVGWSFEIPDKMPNADLIVHAQYVKNVVIITNNIS